MTDDDASDAIHTIARPVRTEIEKIKDSRFICDLAPADDEAVSLEFVDRIRSVEPGATHHCWAYRLGSGRARSSDDGEPGGTAGPPILRRLESADLSDVVAVVTRYYGGTNLGTGGLIRAYGAAAAAAIEAAERITRRRTVWFRLTHRYDLSAAIDGVLAANEARVTSSRYAAEVTLEVLVPTANAASFTAAVRDATAGVVAAARIQP